MMQSTAIAVLPMARSPMISSRWPRPSANIESSTSRPVCTGSLTKSRSMMAGAGTLDRLVTLRRRSRRHRSSGRPSGSTSAAEEVRPDRHAHDFAGAVDEVAGFDCIGIVEQNAAERIAIQSGGKANLAALETQKLIEPDSG